MRILDIESILNIFDEEYFTEKGSHKTTKLIQQHIKKFELEYTDSKSLLIKTLRDNLPELEFNYLSLFFHEDRCIRVIVGNLDHPKYIIQVSIFGYFSIYSRQYNVKPTDRLDRLKFHNQQDIQECDLIYTICKKIYGEMMWLDEKYLKTKDNKLSKEFPDSIFEGPIILNDVIFTTHYY